MANVPPEDWPTVRMRKQSFDSRNDAKNKDMSIRRQIQIETETESVSSLLLQLKKSKFKDSYLLKRLKCTLASSNYKDKGFGDKLLEKDEVLHDLMSALLCGTPEVVQILANCPPFKHKKNAIVMALNAGPYLVTLCTSPCSELREGAYIAIGNLSSSGSKVSNILIKQEALSTLIERISDERSVESALYYGLYRLLLSTSELSKSSFNRIFSQLLEKLSKESSIELHWVLFALSVNFPSDIFPEYFIPRVFEILVYEIFQKSDVRPLVKIVTPIVRTLANICSTNSEMTLCILRQPDLGAILTTLLGTNYIHLVKETLWWIGNIVNNDSISIQEELVSNDLLDKLEYHVAHAFTKIDPFNNNNFM